MPWICAFVLSAVYTLLFFLTSLTLFHQVVVLKTGFASSGFFMLLLAFVLLAASLHGKKRGC